MKASLNLAWVSLFLVAISACSSSKKLPESNEEGEASAQSAAPDAGTDPVPSATAEVMAPPVMEGVPPVVEAVPAPAAKIAVQAAEIPLAPRAEPELITAKDAATTGPTSYKIQKGDTLMKIAFEVYGDLYRWRELLDSNRAAVADPSSLKAGTVLTVTNPVSHLQISKNGDRYEIKSGNTLGTIAQDVYGTSKRWKKLWDNNRELIKDPNKIYAGLFLYFQPDSAVRQKPLAQDGSPGERSTASQ